MSTLPRSLRRLLTFLVLVGLLAGVETSRGETKPPPPEFQRDILPIFAAKCLRCHGEKRRDGKLDLRTLPAMLRGGSSGAALVPGNAGKSLLVELIHFDEMPPKKDKNRVTPEELQRIRAWVDAGAPVGKGKP